MLKNRIASLCVFTASLIAVPAACLAGTTTEDKPAPIEEKPVSRISGDLGVSVISQYISRGLVLNNQGPISQDYADLYFNLYESKTGFLNKVQFNLGIWADLDPHSTQAGTAPRLQANGSPNSVTLPWFYEFDFLPGVSFTFAKYFTFTPSYYAFLSPSSAFRTFQGLNLNLGIDDSPLLGKFALHPSLTFLRELYNKCGSGKQEGNYYEIGLSPSTTAGPVTITLPITAGFGSSRFYANNRGFGYFTPGIQLGVPLKFIPSSYGTWNFTTFYKFYYLGNSLSNFNTGNPTPGFGDNSVRERGHDEHVFSAALVMTFP